MMNMQSAYRFRSIVTLTQTSSNFLSFHSTSASFEKWKSRWNSVDERKGKKPPKDVIRFSTRQKRADTKKALKDLLYANGAPKFTFQDDDANATIKMDRANCWGAEDDHSDRSDKKGPSKFSRRASKANFNRIRRKIRRENLFDEFDDQPGTTFQATFGNRWYTWSFKPFGDNTFENSTTGFTWREENDSSTTGSGGRKHSNRRNARRKEWDTAGETDSDDEACIVGLSSDRTMLGLPPSGPLKIEDVKNAFRSSALKWHPDRHQGPSQVMAEEKFKLCVNAYKSLCNALSSV